MTYASHARVITGYTCQSRWPGRTNQEPRLWANGFFKIEGFAGKLFLLSPPLPPSFHFFALTPIFRAFRMRKTNIRGPNFVRFGRERLLRKLGGRGHGIRWRESINLMKIDRTISIDIDNDFRKGYKFEILQHTLRNFKFLNSALR